MASEAPAIACTLDFQDIAQRLARVRQLAQRSLLRHRLEGNTLHLAYQAGAGDEVRAIVELERVCCAFLDFNVAQSKDEIVLSIQVPEDAGEASQLLISI